ncbi:MAG: septum formation initiator family protein [Rhizobiaceae bacterium]|nr:septum formation initiator family protein [Rhizobiaceae bacterium]
MWTRHHKQRNFGRLILPTITAGFLAYFGFHVYHGAFGINSKHAFEARAAELQGELDEIRGQRIELERKVQLLHDGTLEKDMLDEQARLTLDVSHPSELTIMRDGSALR